MDSKLRKLLGLSSWMDSAALYFSSGAVTTNSRGQTAIPELDFETAHITANTTSVLGHLHATTLQAVTINAPGTTWAIDIWKLTSPTSSSLVAAIASPAASQTLWYYAAGPFGFLFNPKSGTPGSLTISFRENVLA